MKSQNWLKTKQKNHNYKCKRTEKLTSSVCEELKDTFYSKRLINCANILIILELFTIRIFYIHI